VYTVLKENVYSYFQNHNLRVTGNYKLYLKALTLLILYLAVYIHLVFYTSSSAPLALAECVLLGLLTAGIGFNIMHDGAHGSFSKRSRLNRLAALSIDFLGASSFMWHSKHNIIHHTYTNIDTVDDDIEARPFLRLAPTQKYYPIHRYQHLYFWLFYGLLYIVWVFYTDYKKYFTGKVGNIPIRKMKTTDHFTFWGFKIMHLALFILLPVYMVGFSTWIIGFLTYTIASGLVLSLIFQLAHTVKETAFPIPVQPANKIEDEWAVHQLKTTANFAIKNKIVTWFTGGLNYQVEHHLFPKISHVHYPAISKIIKLKCAELGVPYIEHKKMITAIASHIAYLKELGIDTKKQWPQV
jgi:linoleoyl-CoA desaturase